MTSKACVVNPSSLTSLSLFFSSHRLSDFVKPASSKGKSIEDIQLSEDELQLYLDLAPFLNPSPYVVPEDMSLAKVSTN
jgi:hypothetical protein